jgi:hypothetical protein
MLFGLFVLIAKIISVNIGVHDNFQYYTPFLAPLM